MIVNLDDSQRNDTIGIRLNQFMGMPSIFIEIACLDDFRSAHPIPFASPRTEEMVRGQMPTPSVVDDDVIVSAAIKKANGPSRSLFEKKTTIMSIISTIICDEPKWLKTDRGSIP